MPKAKFDDEDDIQTSSKDQYDPESMKADVDEDLSQKFYYVELPSDGRLSYPATIEYRDILVRDEKVLAMATSGTYMKSMNKVLKSILNNADFFEDLTIADRDFLLMWIWANNYSPTKSLEINCFSCKNVDEHVVDLTEVPIDHLSGDYSEPFTIPMKHSPSVKEVSVRLPRVKDEMASGMYVKNNGLKEHEQLDVMLALCIDIKGKKMPLKEKLKFIEDKITSRDMARVKQFFEYFHYGVDDKIKHECSACGEVTHGRIPFQPEWFIQPTVQDDFEEIVRLNRKTEDSS